MRIILFDLHCALVAETVGEGFYVRIDSVVSSNCSRDYIVSCYYTCFISPVGKQRHLAPPPYDHVVTAPVRAAAMHNTPYMSSFFWRAEGSPSRRLAFGSTSYDMLLLPCNGVNGREIQLTIIYAPTIWRRMQRRLYEHGKYAILLRD
jgi:hypothetical protein